MKAKWQIRYIRCMNGNGLTCGMRRCSRFAGRLRVRTMLMLSRKNIRCRKDGCSKSHCALYKCAPITHKFLSYKKRETTGDKTVCPDRLGLAASQHKETQDLSRKRS